MKRLTAFVIAALMATTLMAQGRKGVPQIPVTHRATLSLLPISHCLICRQRGLLKT